MSPSLLVVSGRDVVRAFVEASRRSSHVKLRNEEGRIVIVPMRTEFARGTLRSMLREAGLSVDTFVELL